MSPVINELASALSKAQAEMGAAFKSAQNPFFKSTYATFEDIREASIPSLTKNNLSVTQVTAIENSEIVVKTVLMHSSGQWISGTYPVIASKKDPQGYKSALTYARRATWESLVGIGTTDDDGERAMDRDKVEDIAKKHKVPKTMPTIHPSSNHVFATQKAEAGVFVGKSFFEILKTDEATGFQWSLARKKELDSGKKTPSWLTDYFLYAADCGLELGN